MRCSRSCASGRPQADRPPTVNLSRVPSVPDCLMVRRVTRDRASLDAPRSGAPAGPAPVPAASRRQDSRNPVVRLAGVGQCSSGPKRCPDHAEPASGLRDLHAAGGRRRTGILLGLVRRVTTRSQISICLRSGSFFHIAVGKWYQPRGCAWLSECFRCGLNRRTKSTCRRSPTT
jgi:hypothetical protein